MAVSYSEILPVLLAAFNQLQQNNRNEKLQLEENINQVEQGLLDSHKQFQQKGYFVVFIKTENFFQCQI